MSQSRELRVGDLIRVHLMPHYGYDHPRVVMEAALRGRIYSNEVLITRERRAQFNLAVAEARQQRDLQLMQIGR